MRNTTNLRQAGWVLLIGGCLGSTGCIHNHYYGQVPVCEPGAAVTTYGAVCEVPASGAVVSAAPGVTTTVGSPSRVVVSSEPMGVRPYNRGASRFPWKRSESYGLATSSEGGLDDTATR